MKKILLFGGGGHCKACIEVIESTGNFEIIGIIDVKEKIGTKILDYPVIGSDSDLEDIIKEKNCNNVLITVGMVRLSDKRHHLFDKLIKYNVNFVTVHSPHALISRRTKIHEGTIIFPGVKINCGVEIGRNCIINTGAIIEHDSIINDHCHISTGSIINGECNIGADSLIGSNSTILQCLDIADKTVVGAGAVVFKNLNQSGIYIGNPAKIKL